jgi:hypothetical protein
MWRKQIKEDYKNRKKSSYNFEGNSRPNCNPLCQKMERKKCKFKVKLNDYWMNLHKN